jgi:hypothetical protein
MRCTVDTNVPIVANGRPDPTEQSRRPSIDCRLKAVARLTELRAHGTILLDMAGEIQKEYRRYLSPSGQPGVGDLFYREIINSAPGRVERVDLPQLPSGEYQDFPTDPALARFDPSDRKFAALSRRERAPVVTATDSDWIDHRSALEANGVQIEFVCGCDRKRWFEP